MKQLIAITTGAALLLLACGQSAEPKKPTPERTIPKLPKIETSYQLTDYLSENEQLNKDVDSIFASLDDTAIVAQLIMPAVGEYGQTLSTIKKHISKRQIGGVLMLNGTKAEFTKWITDFNTMNVLLGNSCTVQMPNRVWSIARSKDHIRLKKPMK